MPSTSSVPAHCAFGTTSPSTATATPEVARDIVSRLGLREPVHVATGFDRPNLAYSVVPCVNKEAVAGRIAAALSEPDALPAIVYAGTRAESDRLADRLGRELGVEVVAVSRATAAQDLQLAFYAEAQARGFSAGGFPVPKILAGPDAATELAAWPCDTVLNGMTGSVGLAPTLAALEAGRTLALANKESLVAGGPLVQAAVQRPDQLVPVDSEHSALAQCLRGGRADEVRRLVLTHMPAWNDREL